MMVAEDSTVDEKQLGCLELVERKIDVVGLLVIAELVDMALYVMVVLEPVAKGEIVMVGLLVSSIVLERGHMKNQNYLRMLIGLRRRDLYLDY